MLIQSPRHTSVDLARWAELERYDSKLATSEILSRAEERSIDILVDFAASGPCYCGVSWGKDSVVVAHLVRRVVPEVVLGWIKVDTTHNPDCPIVRDVFLESYPGPYLEATIDYETNHAGKGFESLVKLTGTDRYISGVRAEESGVRKVRMRSYGASTKRTCAPIGWWTGQMVFAYLCKYNLPVHPAYAMSMNGTLDRNKIRVSSLHGPRQIHGKAEWEKTYYGDSLRQWLSEKDKVR